MKLMALLTIEDIADKFDGFMDKLIPSSFIPVLVQLIATAVIFVVVAKFIFKPVRQILRTRQEYISKQISDSEEAKAKALEYEQTAKDSISVAQEKSKEILKNAEEQSKNYREKALLDLEKELKDNREKAKEEIEKEKEQAVEEIRKEIIDVALQASEVVLNREITEDDNKRLVNEFVEDIIN